MPSKKKYVPNSRLPKGAVLLKRPVTKKVGSWAQMDYDAKVQRLGLTWWRTKGGFSQGNPNQSLHPREDWCAEIPTGCLSVSNDDWDGSAPFGYEHQTLYPNFDAAIIGETKAFLSEARRDEACCLAAFKLARKAVEAIERATKSKRVRD